MQRFRILWDFLTSPHQRIIDEEHRANSKLLSAIILAVIPGVLISLAARMISGAISRPGFLAAVAAIISLLVIYTLNRRGYLIIAGILFDLTAIGSVLAQALINRNAFLFLFLLLPLLISSLFQPFKFTVAMLISVQIFIISQPFFNPAFEVDSAYLFTAGYMVFGAIMIVMYKTHRDRLEKIRRQRLEESELRY